MQVLESVKVLDLCRGYPPAFSAMLMADFGADVIKVDPTGFVVPFPGTNTEAKEIWSVYSFWDRNKRSIMLNLSSQQGKEILFKLAKTADVLIENSRPGTMGRLGIGYNDLKDINTRLIYCAVSGYGQDGPYSSLVGHDNNYLGICGTLSLIGPKDGPPVMPSNIIADIAGAGLHPFMSILLALIARQNTGRGQFIDISYTDCVFAMTGFDVAMYLMTGEKRRRGEFAQSGGAPCSAVYQTKDGEYVAVQIIEPTFWANFCNAIGKPDFVIRQWPEDEKEKEDMFTFLGELFLTKTRDEWWEWAKTNQVMLAPVLYIEEALDDPHLRYRQMVVEKEHPRLGKVIHIGNPLKLSDTPPDPTRSYSPLPGQHTDQILSELDYNEHQIAELKKQKAVEQS